MSGPLHFWRTLALRMLGDSLQDTFEIQRDFISLGPVVLGLWNSGTARVHFDGNIIVGELIPASGNTGISEF